jgi:hypothetical protein
MRYLIYLEYRVLKYGVRNWGAFYGVFVQKCRLVPLSVLGLPRLTRISKTIGSISSIIKIYRVRSEIFLSL